MFSKREHIIIMCVIMACVIYYFLQNSPWANNP